MKAVVVGFSGVREGDYNGRHWRNRQLYINRFDKLPDDVIGQCAETLKVSADLDLSDIAVGQEVEIYYNRYGRVDAVVGC